MIVSKHSACSLGLWQEIISLGVQQRFKAHTKKQSGFGQWRFCIFQGWRLLSRSGQLVPEFNHWHLPRLQRSLLLCTAKSILIPFIINPIGSCREQFNLLCALLFKAQQASSFSSPMSCAPAPRHLCDMLQHVHVFLVLGSPKLDTGLQMWSHKCQEERKKHFAQPLPCPVMHVCRWFPLP